MLSSKHVGETPYTQILFRFRLVKFFAGGYILQVSVCQHEGVPQSLVPGPFWGLTQVRTGATLPWTGQRVAPPNRTGNIPLPRQTGERVLLRHE